MIKESAIANERNALAELAERMDEDSYTIFRVLFGTAVMSGIYARMSTAQRIIAELAKASDAIGYADEFAKDGCKECIYIPATQQLCVKKILKCREIAEEGITK